MKRGDGSEFQELYFFIILILSLLVWASAEHPHPKSLPSVSEKEDLR